VGINFVARNRLLRCLFGLPPHPRYNLGVAHSPMPRTKSSLETYQDAFRLRLAEYIFKGIRPAKIARRLSSDPVKQRRLYRRIRRMVRNDPELRSAVLARTQEEFLFNIGPITERLNQRARALGKPDSVKLVYEASGFHNPRVKHEHGGQVEIKLTIPRPEIPKAVGNAEVVEAEAVDEDA